MESFFWNSSIFCLFLRKILPFAGNVLFSCRLCRRGTYLYATAKPAAGKPVLNRDIDFMEIGLHFYRLSIIVDAKFPTRHPDSSGKPRNDGIGKEVVPLKIERINENQIRCTLTSVDLNARNIRLSELAYGSDKTRNLFREMIQQASIETGFDVDDIPLVIEAIPLASGSIMLIITKVEDPEELDSRFSRFTPSPEEDLEEQLPPMESEQLDGADSLMNLLSTFAASLGVSDPAAPDAEDAGMTSGGIILPPDDARISDEGSAAIGQAGGSRNASVDAQGSAKAPGTENAAAAGKGNAASDSGRKNASADAGRKNTPADSERKNASADAGRKNAAARRAAAAQKPATRFYAFPNLDAAITAAKICDPAYAGKSTLYKSPAGTFLLVLHVDNADNLPFIHICNRLSDFASRQKHPDAAEAFYAEHYDPIIREDALRHLAEL